MKLLHIVCTFFTIITVASAASSPKRMAKRRSPARHDPHRMLQKRATRFATGPGQGAIEIAALQDAIMGRRIAPVKRARKAVSSKSKRLSGHKKLEQRAKKWARRQSASVFETRDESCDDTASAEETALAVATAQATAAATAAAYIDTSSNGNSTSSECDCDNSGSDGDASQGSSSSSSNNGSSNTNNTSSTSSGDTATIAKNAAVASHSHSHSGGNAPSSSSSNGSGGSTSGSENTATSDASSQSSSTSASASAGGSGTGQVYSGGIATFFYQNGNAGACGQVNPDSASIVALPTPMYNNGALCGKSIIVTDVSTGNTATATVADECPTCPDANSLDMSVGLFTQFASEDQGTFSVSWQLAG